MLNIFAQGGMDASLAGIGHRIYEVRRALGPDPRHEMPQRQFAELLNTRAALLFPDPEERPRYDSSVIARLEKGGRRVTVADVTVVAAVDPRDRGKLWLGWGEQEQQQRTPLASYQVPESIASALAGEPPAAQAPAPKPAERPPAKNATRKR